MPAKFASLHAGLLARKGEAKPALSSSAVWTLIAEKVGGDEASNDRAEPALTNPAVSYVDTPRPVQGENAAIRPLIADEVGGDGVSSGEAKPALANPAVSYVDTPRPVQGEEDATIRPLIADEVGGDGVSSGEAKPALANPAVSYVDTPRPVQGNEDATIRPLIADEVGGDGVSSGEAKPALANPAVSHIDTPRPVQGDEHTTIRPLIADEVGGDQTSNDQLIAMPMNGGPHVTSSTPAGVMVDVHDVIFTATDEEFSRSELELRIAKDPLFDHAIVIGNNRPFVVVQVVLNASAWILLATAHGIDPDDPSTREAETVLIERIRSATKDLPSYCQVRRVHATLEHARRASIIAAKPKPAKGARKAASQRRNNRLTLDQLRAASGMAEQSGNGPLRRVFWATLDRLH